MFCVILLVQGAWEIKILVSGLSEKNVTQRLRFTEFISSSRKLSAMAK